MLLNNEIQKFFVQMILHFQKERNVIMLLSKWFNNFVFHFRVTLFL
jgi:hypothetical protein